MKNPSKNRRRGKHTESAIAMRLGGKRLGILGNDDVQAGAFSIEAKDQVKFVGTGFMAQAVRNCPQDKTPLVIVHTTGAGHDNDLVIMRLSDWAWTAFINATQGILGALETGLNTPETREVKTKKSMMNQFHPARMN
jgi:hypothetical protein